MRSTMSDNESTDLTSDAVDLVIAMANEVDFARHPAGWLRGKAALRLTQLSRKAGGRIAVVVFHEWIKLPDEVSRSAYLIARIERAMLGCGIT